MVIEHLRTGMHPQVANNGGFYQTKMWNLSSKLLAEKLFHNCNPLECNEDIVVDQLTWLISYFIGIPSSF